LQKKILFVKCFVIVGRRRHILFLSCKKEKRKKMTSVTNNDLLALLTILYQGTVRKSNLAITTVFPSPVRYFLFDDISVLATEYSLPLPSAPLADVLRVGLARGVYLKSVQRGTQCGRMAYINPSSGASPCEETTNTPVMVYGYNPNLAKMNVLNQALLNPMFLAAQNVSGSVVRFQDNHTVCYGTRGSWSTSLAPFRSRYVPRSTCCAR
jgi:hypothetical protein